MADTKKHKEQDYALAAVVMRMVIKQDDCLKLHPRAPEGFKLALDELFEHPKLDPKEEIEAVVRLGWLFEKEQNFELADEVLDLMAKDDRVLSVLGITTVSKTRNATKQFSRMLGGEEEKLAAPVYGKDAPAGSIKVSSFLEPGRELGRARKPTPTPSKKTSAETKRRFKS